MDRENCIGCGVAPATCPEVFEMISDRKNAVVEKYRANNDPAIGIVSSD
ncbi:MAG: ferredoxin [Candidatus Njordarchaeota archaeon]